MILMHAWHMSSRWYESDLHSYHLHLSICPPWQQRLYPGAKKKKSVLCSCSHEVTACSTSMSFANRLLVRCLLQAQAEGNHCASPQPPSHSTVTNHKPVWQYGVQWFPSLYIPYEAHGWQAICNRHRSKPSPPSYRHLKPIWSTPACKHFCHCGTYA